MSSVSFAAFTVSVPTRSADAAEAQGLGLSGEAADLFCAARAPARAGRRAAAAVAAAIAWAVGHWGAPLKAGVTGLLTAEQFGKIAAAADATAAVTAAQVALREALDDGERGFSARTEALEAVLAAAFAALALDESGVGGTLNAGIGQVRGDRHPAFSGLGKGRKGARDGGAWTTAIAAARAAVGQALSWGGCRLGWVIEVGAGGPNDGAGALAVLAVDGGHAVSTWRGIACHDDPDFWHHVTAARAVIVAAARGGDSADVAAAGEAVSRFAAQAAARAAEADPDAGLSPNGRRYSRDDDDKVASAKAALADAQGIYDDALVALVCAESDLRAAEAGVGLLTVEDAQAALAVRAAETEAAFSAVNAAHNALLDAQKGDTSWSW